MKLINKIFDALISAGETCRSLTYSNKVDIVREINGKDPDGPHFTFRINGGYSVKLIKLVAAVGTAFATLGTLCAILSRMSRPKRSADRCKPHDKSEGKGNGKRKGRSNKGKN